MSEVTEMYHFKECGLPYVWLADGYEISKTVFGDVVRIEDLEGLHQAIARNLTAQQERLTGAELRFLRSVLGVSQEGLGDLIGKSRATVARWESHADSNTIERACDRLVKIFCAKKLDGDERVGKILDMLGDVDEHQHGVKRAEFSATRNGWMPTKSRALEMC